MASYEVFQRRVESVMEPLLGQLDDAGLSLEYEPMSYALAIYVMPVGGMRDGHGARIMSNGSEWADLVVLDDLWVNYSDFGDEFVSELPTMIRDFVQIAAAWLTDNEEAWDVRIGPRASAPEKAAVGLSHRQDLEATREPHWVYVEDRRYYLTPQFKEKVKRWFARRFSWLRKGRAR